MKFRFKRFLFNSLRFLFFTATLSSYHLEQQEVGSFLKKGETTSRCDVTNFFHKTNLSFGSEQIILNPLILQKAANDALHYFESKSKETLKIIRPQVFSKNIMDIDKVKNTLKFVINCIEQDKQSGRPFRILNPDFLNKNFKFIKWSGDVDVAYKNKVVIPENTNNGKIPQGNIRLTKYAVFIFDGSECKSKDYPYALYSIVDNNFAQKDRFKYTKHQILAGVLEAPVNKGKVEPLVWLSRQGIEEAIMQGTVIVKMPDNKRKVFCVDKNNGIIYDKKIKNTKAQKRYWYFKEIKTADYFKRSMHIHHPEAIFAGDIYNIGLGKIVAIRYKNAVNGRGEVRLGVLSDSGGAFANNLYQLDLFMGVHKNKQQFYKKIRHIPNAVEAYILEKV